MIQHTYRGCGYQQQQQLYSGPSQGRLLCANLRSESTISDQRRILLLSGLLCLRSIAIGRSMLVRLSTNSAGRIILSRSHRIIGGDIRGGDLITFLTIK